MPAETSALLASAFVVPAVVWETRSAVVSASIPSPIHITAAGVVPGKEQFALPAARIASEILERPIAAITTIKDEENALHLNGPVDVSDMRLVVIDDVHSYSTSIKLVGKLVVEGGASVVGAAVLMNRNPYGVNRAVIAGQEILVRSLIQHPIADYSPEDCPFEAGLGMFEPEN